MGAMAPAPRKDIDPTWAQKMADTRRMATAIFEALLSYTERLPPDEALAFISGLRGDPRYHWAEPTRLAIEAARAAGLTWREVAVASEGDESAEGRVASKQHWRNEAHGDFQAGVGPFQPANDPGSGGMPAV